MFLTKKYIKKINKKAFTIIELSIVILVISVMVVGVVTGKSLIAKSRLANAKSLTRQSVINDMGDDLIAWYETSLEDSFIPSEIKNDGSKISMWKDSNKNAVNKNDANQTTDANKPSLYQNVFYNSIPGLRFLGAQFLNFEGKRFAKNSYTVFVVEQRTSNKSENIFIGGTNNLVNSNLILGYGSNTSISFAQYANDFTRSTESYKFTIPRIHTFSFNNSIGKSHSINGGSTATNNPAQPNSLVSFNGAMIARYNPDGNPRVYVGDLAEIIMFKRSLKTEEVEAIESYLGSKYGIPVS